MSQQTVTKREAYDRGLKRYFTGKPCSKGHIAERHLTGTCVECAKLAVKRWEARNPGEASRRSREWYRKNPERAKKKARHWARVYAGIPAAERPQPAACECCGAEGRQMHLDHDRTTGKFRGWLCNRCNLGVGMLGDTIAGVTGMLDYLRRNGSS